MELLRRRHIIDRDHTTFADRVVGEQNASISQVTRQTVQKAADQSTSQNANLWHRIMRFIQRHSREIRRALIEEQQTAMFGSAVLGSDYPDILYGLGNETWIDIKTVYYSGGGTVKFPINNSHFQKSTVGAWSEWIAPEDGDYKFDLFCQLKTADAEHQDYAELLMQVYDNTSHTWLTPIVCGAAANVTTDDNRLITAVGWMMLRMARGNRCRFGLKTIGQSADRISVSTLEYRVAVAKQKMYPTLYTP